VVVLLAVSTAWLVSGCDEDDYEDHVPPKGKGSLVIDNDTFDDLSLYVDGNYTARVGDGSERIFDLDPGVHRVVLDEGDDDDDRSFRDYVDVLAGQLTVLKVRADVDDIYAYDVRVEFE